MKQMQTCASIRLSVKWNIGLISKLPLLILKSTRSTTHNPVYCFMTSSPLKSVLVM